DGLGLDLLDAAAGADRLIVKAVAGLLLIGVRPFGVDRIGEGRAGARNIQGSGRDRDRGERARRHQPLEQLHRLSPWCGRETSRTRGPTAALPGSVVMRLGFRLTPSEQPASCPAVSK